MYQMAVFRHRPRFLFLPRAFSGALSRGARRGPRCVYTRLKFGLRSRSVERALSVQSREKMARNYVICFRRATSSACQDNTDPHVSILLFSALLLASGWLLLLLYHVRFHCPWHSLLCCSRGITAVAHQALPVLTATDGAPIHACACLCRVSCRPRK